MNRHWWCAGLLLLGACGASADPGSVDEQPSPGDPTRSDNGQTGSIGAAECELDADCEAELDRRLEEFEAPGTYYHRFDSSACAMVSIIAEGDTRSGHACECHVIGSGSGTYPVGPAGSGCSNYGRLLDCIYPASDFPGCDPNDADSCTEVCADMEARLAADAALTYTTSIRLARCEAFQCKSVVQIGDGCYANVTTQALKRQDCSLSDEQILAEP